MAQTNTATETTETTTANPLHLMYSDKLSPDALARIEHAQKQLLLLVIAAGKIKHAIESDYYDAHDNAAAARAAFAAAETDDERAALNLSELNAIERALSNVKRDARTAYRVIEALYHDRGEDPSFR